MTDIELVLVLLLVVDALALLGLVLLQQGKGADVGAAFGSGGSNTMFGSAGSATFLTKMTVWLAVGFFIISFALAYLAKQRATEIDSLGIPSLGGVERSIGEGALDDDASKLESLPDAVSDELSGDDVLTPENDSVDSGIPDV